MHIAIEGCSHGELDIIYNTIGLLENRHKLKIDLLICCGDFQSVRNEKDLKCMAVPPKFMQMHDFYQYYSGNKKAPVLTIFIGGNHEASNYLQELPYGGWVAPNIYYLGYAGVVNFGGIRIAGLSGIYKGHDYLKGHFEKAPYTGSSVRSAYHVRKLDVFRLKQLSKHFDIVLSHDWPRGIYNHGNVDKLLKVKQYFAEEVRTNSLGSLAAEDLLDSLKPDYWFSGHLHVKFAAILKHKERNPEKPAITRFLALDKCLPRREFLQVLEIPNKENSDKPYKLNHDVEWLTVLRLTNHLLTTSDRINYMPGPGSKERHCFTPSQLEIEETLEKMGGSLEILASKFVQTAPSYDDSRRLPDMNFVEQPKPVFNPQTEDLCSRLEIDDPMRLLLGNESKTAASIDLGSSFNSSFTSNVNSSYCLTDQSTNQDEINLSDDEVDESKKLYRNESGDFIFEVPISPSVSKLSIESTFSPIHKRERLSLGKPSNKLDFSTATSSDSSGQEEKRPEEVSEPKQPENVCSEPEIKTDNPENGSDFLSFAASNESPPIKRTSTETIQNTPDKIEPKKKFKRRNESFYNSDD